MGVITKVSFSCFETLLWNNCIEFPHILKINFVLVTMLETPPVSTTDILFSNILTVTKYLICKHFFLFRNWHSLILFLYYDGHLNLFKLYHIYLWMFFFFFFTNVVKMCLGKSERESQFFSLMTKWLNKLLLFNFWLWDFSIGTPNLSALVLPFFKMSTSHERKWILFFFKTYKENPIKTVL